MKPNRWENIAAAPEPRRGPAGMMVAYALLAALILAAVAIIFIKPDTRDAAGPSVAISLPRIFVAMPKLPPPDASPPVAPAPAPGADKPPAPAAQPAPPSNQTASTPPDSTPSAAQPGGGQLSGRPADPPSGQPSGPSPNASQPAAAPNPVISTAYSLRGPNYPPPPPEKPDSAGKSQAVAATTPGGRPDPVASLGDYPEPDAAGIVERGPYGPMPRISPEGRLPFIVNAHRFNHSSPRPRVALAIMGLGLNAQVTEDAITKLPAGVSLIFDPYTPDIERWTRKARAAGHEVLIALPMEADAASKADLGKRVLTSKLSPAETVDRLRWVLSRSTVIAGVASWEGGGFLTSAAHYRPVLAEIAGRGLLMFDTRMARPNVVQEVSAGIGLPFARSLGFFDEHQDKETIDSNLATMEDRARQRRFAVAIGSPYPLTIDRVVNWARGLEQRGFDLAPITGVTECGDLCRERVRKQMAVDGVAKP